LNILEKPKGDFCLRKSAAALFQPKSRRKSFRQVSWLGLRRQQPSHAKNSAMAFLSLVGKIGLTVAVTTRDLHPLPYSLVATRGNKHLKSHKKNCPGTAANYHAI
jgi:hypothetical protein